MSFIKRLLNSIRSIFKRDSKKPADEKESQVEKDSKDQNDSIITTTRKKPGSIKPTYFQELIIESNTPDNEDHFINLANELYDIDLRSIPGLKVNICPCEPKVALISVNSFPDGVLHPEGSKKSDDNGSNNGDTNFYSSIKNERNILGAFMKSKPKDLKTHSFPDKTAKSINIAFLDTYVDCDFLFHLSNLNNNNIKTENISLEFQDCVTDKEPETDHGTAVVFCFLNEFYSHPRNADKKVHLHIFNVTRKIEIDGEEEPDIVVTQFKVLCSLYKIKAIKNIDYINMSFGFSTNLPILEKLLKKQSENKPPIINAKITCSAGNDGLDISNGSGDCNYPSGYAREEGYPNIIEVFGAEIENHPRSRLSGYNNVWLNLDGGMESNRLGTPHDPTGTSEANAVFYRNDNRYEGGTSFAAPRKLANIITGVYAEN